MTSSEMNFKDQLEVAAGDAPSPDIDQLWRTGRRRANRQRALVGTGALGAAALIALGATNLRADSGGVEAGPVASQAPPAEVAPAPANGEESPDSSDSPGLLDHWHAAFGLRVCGEFLPNLQADLDPLGIHSHQDGVIHIHPFFEESAGKNATLGLFFDSVGIEVSGNDSVQITARVPADEAIAALLDERVENCAAGSDTEVGWRLAQWDFAFQVENPAYSDDDHAAVTFDNFESARFLHDRMVFVLEYGLLDAPTTGPPSIEQLNKATGPSVTRADALIVPSSTATAAPGAVDAAIAALSESSFYVESGAQPVDVALLKSAISKATAADFELRVAVLAHAEDPLTAEDITDRFGGTAVVFTPQEYFVSSTDFSQDAIKAAIRQEGSTLQNAEPGEATDELVGALIATEIPFAVDVGGDVLEFGDARWIAWCSDGILTAMYISETSQELMANPEALPDDGAGLESFLLLQLPFAQIGAPQVLPTGDSAMAVAFVLDGQVPPGEREGEYSSAEGASTGSFAIRADNCNLGEFAEVTIDALLESELGDGGLATVNASGRIKITEPPAGF